MKKLRVRIVILHYNDPEMVLRCLQFVLKQTYPFTDVVVVDNASTLENFEKLKRLTPENVVVIRNEFNSGYSAGNNFGIRYSGIVPPDFILILNPDAFLVDNQSISKLVEVLENAPNIVAVTPLVKTGITDVPAVKMHQVCRNSGFFTYLVAYSWWLRETRIFKKIVDRHFYQERIPYRTEQNYECDTLHGCCFMIKKDFFEKINYFDEGTFLFFEEMILGYQIKMKSKRCILVTSVIAEHLGGSKNIDAFSKKNFSFFLIQLRSQTYFLKKYLGIGIFWCVILWLVRLFGFFVKLFLFSFYKRKQ